MLLLIYVIVSSSYRVDEEYEYVGSDACHVCHESEDCGNQTAVWMKGPHARAYRSLGSGLAKKHAQKILGKDVEPQKHEVCLHCHSTAGELDEEHKGASYDMNEGVGCEACHGPGSAYSKLDIMKSPEKFLTKGGIKDYKICQKCHENGCVVTDIDKLKESYKKLLHPVNKKD